MLLLTSWGPTADGSGATATVDCSKNSLLCIAGFSRCPRRQQRMKLSTRLSWTAKAWSKCMLRILKTEMAYLLQRLCPSYGKALESFVNELHPGDHDSNPEIERDIRTDLRGRLLGLWKLAVAPAYLWAEDYASFCVHQEYVALSAC